MGFLGLLRFSLMCLDFLAWPAFALGYPIWASIRAIETGSKYHMKKLITYWTIFSLISLLEHTFKLVQWVPFWSYTKLIAISWLVIPHFNGASHVYECLLHPCLSVNLKTIINWFCWLEEKASVKETFLTSVETYVKENGSDALEKLIASKGKCKEHQVADAQNAMEKVELTEKNVVAEEPLGKCKEHQVTDAQKDMEKVELTEKNVVAEQPQGKCKEYQVADAQKDMKKVELTEKNVVAEQPRLLHLNVADAREDKERVESTEKNVVAEEQPVKHQLANLAKTENKTTTAVEVPGMSIPAVTEEKRPLEIPAVKKVQREWTCAVCQVTTTSEVTLKSHLKGKKHKSKSVELKTGKKTAKNVQSSPSIAAASNHGNNKTKNCKSGEKPKQNPTEKLVNAHNSATSGKHTQKKPNNAGVVTQHSKLWCVICNIRCSGEIDMAAHLMGRKHLHQIQCWANSVSGGQA